MADTRIRLLSSGSDSSVLAFTAFDGTHHRVQVADAVAGPSSPPRSCPAPTRTPSWPTSPTAAAAARSPPG